MRIGKNTPWLVKSSGRILGPYFENEIISLLRTREIVLIDELSRPCGRWIYIRDEPAFAGIAEELRQKNLKTLNDETTARLEQTLTPTNTISVTAAIDDRTEEISHIIDLQPQNVQTIGDVLSGKSSQGGASFGKEASGGGSSGSDSRSGYGGAGGSVSADTYVFEGDRVVQRETQGLSRFLWALTAIVLFSSVGYVAFRQYVAKPIQNKEAALANLDSAHEALSVGDYPSALALFKRAHQADSRDMRTYLPLAVLYLQIENQTVQARRLLESLLATQERDRQRILTALGIADLMDRRFPEAEKRFNRALEVDPLFKPALINLGANALIAGDPEKANNHLQIAIKDGSREGLEQVMVVEALTQLFQKEKDKSYLQQAERFLSQYLRPYKPYYLEGLIASIYLSHLMQDNARVYQKINLALDADPLATALHRSELYVYRGAVDWQKLAQWCLQSTEKLDPLARVVAFEAICLLKSNQLGDASRKIEDAVQQAPRDSLVQGVYGFILGNLSANDRARVALERAVDFDAGRSFQAPRLYFARYCQEVGQSACAEKYWRELLEIDPNSLPALAALSRIALERGKSQEVQNYLSRGRTLSNTYLPFYVEP